MGFGVENVLIRGRPSIAVLEEWVQAALPRLKGPELQFPGEELPRFVTVDVALNASGRLEVERPQDFTILWIKTDASASAPKPEESLMSFAPVLRLLGIKNREPLQWSPLREASNLPLLPSDRVGADAAQRNAFLLSLALIAKSRGHDSAFFADGSVSDSGCLFIPGGHGLIWSDVDCEVQRQRADDLLRQSFPAIGPDLDELQWAGPGDPFWSRPLVEGGQRLDSPPKSVSKPAASPSRRF